MASLNRAGVAAARAAIRAGRVVDRPWSFTARDGNALLGDDEDWGRYAKAHLGVTDAPEETKAHYSYPWGKLVDGELTLFVSALRAIRSRASQQDETEIFDAAGRLLDEAQPKEESVREAEDGQSVRIQELMQLSPDGRVDTANRRILDVAVLGPQSRNGRTYRESALRDGARVFEGAKVYLNHRRQEAGRTQPRDVRDYVGRLYGLHVADDGKLRARELAVNNPAAWELLGIAEHDPAAFGLSIDAEGVAQGNEVTAIVRAHSVDIVAEPATTTGLFEQKEDEMDLTKLTVDELRAEAPRLVEEIERGARESAENPLREELENVRRELESMRRAAAITEELHAAGLDGRADVLRPLLERCADAQERAALLEQARAAFNRPRSLPPAGDAEALKALDAELKAVWTGRPRLASA